MSLTKLLITSQGQLRPVTRGLQSGLTDSSQSRVQSKDTVNMYLGDAMKGVRLKIGHVTEYIGKQTGQHTHKGNIVKPDQTGVIDADIGYCPV